MTFYTYKEPGASSDPKVNCTSGHSAIQLGVEDAKGSIEAGKDADFLVFDRDLLTAEPQGFSLNKPAEVYMGGVKVN